MIPAVAAILSLLMAPSAALAESDFLSLSIPDEYLRLSQCVHCTESEPLSAAETSAAQAAPAASGQASVKELSQKTTDPTSELALVFTQFAVTVNDDDFN